MEAAISFNGLSFPTIIFASPFQVLNEKRSFSISQRGGPVGVTDKEVRDFDRFSLLDPH
jgi:hypothetical protein